MLCPASLTKAKNLPSLLPQTALWWLCVAPCPSTLALSERESLSFPQTPSCQPPLERVKYSTPSPCTPQPGQSTLPSSFRGLSPCPPPMAPSAPQAAQISLSWPTAPHLASVWCCRSPLGSGAACPSPPPFSIPLLATKGWMLVSF